MWWLATLVVQLQTCAVSDICLTPPLSAAPACDTAAAAAAACNTAAAAVAGTAAAAAATAAAPQVKSKTREVQLHKDSTLGEAVLECYASGNKNVFSLGFVPVAGDNTVVLLARDTPPNSPAVRDLGVDMSQVSGGVREDVYMRAGRECLRGNGEGCYVSTGSAGVHMWLGRQGLWRGAVTCDGVGWVGGPC